MKKKLNKQVSALWGDASGLTGDVSRLRGYVTGLTGDVTGLRGNVDDCDLTASDRAKGINIADLVT